MAPFGEILDTKTSLHLIDLILSLRGDFGVIWCPLGVHRSPKLSPQQRKGRKERK